MYSAVGAYETQVYLDGLGFFHKTLAKIGKGIGRGAWKGVKTVVRIAPPAVAGFIAGGPPGAAVGAASALIGGGSGAVGTPDNVGDTYLDPQTGQVVPYYTALQTRNIVPIPAPPGGRLDLRSIIQAGIDAARGRAAEVVTPIVEPVIRPYVEQRIQDDLRARAATAGTMALPLVVGGGLLYLMASRRRRRN